MAIPAVIAYEPYIKTYIKTYVEVLMHGLETGGEGEI